MIKSHISTRLAVITTVSLFFLFSTTFSLSARDYADKSVLSSGNWIKIKIKETGIYKLTYNQLKEMGITNPQNIQVFGYGGNILSEDYSLNDYIDDLPQVAIWMSSPKESFGTNDYILFYGKGTIKWKCVGNEFIQTQNPYSSDAFYFLTESSEANKVAKVQIATPDNNVGTLTNYQDYYLHEKELINISQTGRHFYGENFDKTSRKQTFNIPLTGVLDSENALISYEFISSPRGRDKVVSSNNATLHVTLNEKNTQSKNIETAGNAYTVATTITDSYSQTLAENNTLTFDYVERTENDMHTHLNYFRITYTRRLQPYGSVTLFRSIHANTKVNFSIANIPANNLVLDVSDASNMTVIEGEKNNNNYKFSASNSNTKEYALVDLSGEIPSPTFVKQVDNQNLHGLKAGKEMVIIVQPHLKIYAERLAEIHLKNSGLQSLIVSPEDIFNEFSSGTPDATAYRSFLKMFLENSYKYGMEAFPKYLLLFGDATYDNRFISDSWSNIDTRAFLLSYQSENSTSEINSFVSDDYFGFLGDSDGGNLKNHKLYLGIGRLPVRTELDAHNLVNKIERYLKHEEQGSWQNNIIFVADDAVGTSSVNSVSERVHMEYCDSFADFLNKDFPDFRTTKLYMDAYERTGLPFSKEPRIPEGRNKMFENINSGGLVLNYMGHGSQFDWTHEYILVSQDVINLKNKHLPLWITATCDFSRFDYDATSAGELALLNPNGGAIALFSTVRVVFASSNKLINSSMFEHLFTEEDGEPLRLGDIIRYSKTRSSNPAMATDGNKLRFQLLGDPAIRLNYPSSKYKVNIETINGSKAIISDTIQLGTLSEVTIKGSIVNNNGKLDTDFNGYVEINAFDNQQKMVTRGQKSSETTISSDSLALKYMDYINNIFTGKAVVSNGSFELSFTIPNDALLSGKNGKMFFIAYDSNGTKAAKGSFSNFTVVKGKSTPVKENIPPTIDKIFLGSEAFASESIVPNEETLYAEISDNTGLNLVAGLGHGITVSIDNIIYDITSSFINEPQSSKFGKIKYQLPSLSAGKHSLTLKIWDVWNNSTTKTISFIVEDNSDLGYIFDLKDKIARNNLELRFSTENLNSEVSITYKVYDKSNSLKWIHQTTGKASVFSNYTYNWDLIGNNGLKLTPGSYLCVVKVKIGQNEEEKTYDFVVL